MSQLNFVRSIEHAPPPRFPQILHKVKDCYTEWYRYYTGLPRIHRFSFGQRIDTLWVEIIEAVSAAIFLTSTEKHSYVKLAIRKVDTVKVLLMILWENNSLENKKYGALSIKIDEIGKMLGGWSGQLTKQNSPSVGLKEK